MSETRPKMHKPHFFQDIRIGIGDMCKITGVTGRQLRYWEERGYIRSLSGDKNSVRKYSWEMLYKVGSIKHFIDEGYTLAKAVEKSDLREKEMKIVHRFLRSAMQGVEITDLEHLYGKVDLGDCNGKRVYGVVDEQGTHLECIGEEQ
ncbi:MerR family transcriptional regulator [Ligilactobacillus apodemi]|nr:MerR family transcriptional regulator [Ligilactobacillus apodemi]MCR1901778.1 MerR family transcriptional regulator [Ligilactobacillus apodemi]